MRMMNELEVSVNAIFYLGPMGRPSFTCSLILFFPIFESHAMWNLDDKYRRGRAFAKPTSRFNSTKFIIIFLWISLCMISLVPSIFLIRNTFFLHKFAGKPAKKAIAVMSIMNDNIESKSPFERPRSVVKKLLSKEQPEGDGALVRRSIGRPELRNLDPFLLLDEFTVTPPGGFPDHPHRGFETVTYMLKGAFTHQDFAGHKGTIKAGDLQWMTAGRGIVHCEMPASKGVQHGLQLWVNLSKKDKMIEPAYQELEDKDIPKVEKDGVRASVIAGEALGIRSPVYTRTPTLFLDFTMKAGAVLHQEVPEGWNAFAYVLEGEAIFGNVDSLAVTAHHTVQLSRGNGLSVWNKFNNPCRFVLIGGRPLNEPVVQYGPFVMNAKDEIIQAIQDYQQSKNGFERAINWHSDPIMFSEAHD